MRVLALILACSGRPRAGRRGLKIGYLSLADDPRYDAGLGLCPADRPAAGQSRRMRARMAIERSALRDRSGGTDRDAGRPRPVADELAAAHQAMVAAGRMPIWSLDLPGARWLRRWPRR